MNYYIYHNEEVVGPYTEDQMTEMLESGFLTNDSLAFPEGSEDWKPVSELNISSKKDQTESKPKPEADKKEEEPKEADSKEASQSTPPKSAAPAKKAIGPKPGIGPKPMTKAAGPAKKGFALKRAPGAGGGIKKAIGPKPATTNPSAAKTTAPAKSAAPAKKAAPAKGNSDADDSQMTDAQKQAYDKAMAKKAGSSGADGKKWLTTLLLCLFLGGLGVHRFYTGKTMTGILMLITLGGLSIWTLVDLIMIILGKYKDSLGRDLVK